MNEESIEEIEKKFSRYFSYLLMRQVEMVIRKSEKW